MRVVHIDDEPFDSGLTQYALRAASGLAARGHASAFWGLAGAPPLEAARAAGLDTLGFRQPWLELPALRRGLAAFRPDLLVAHTGSAPTLAAFLGGRPSSGRGEIRVRSSGGRAPGWSGRARAASWPSTRASGPILNRASRPSASRPRWFTKD